LIYLLPLLREYLSRHLLFYSGFSILNPRNFSPLFGCVLPFIENIGIFTEELQKA